MTYKIQGQNPFQILSTNFSIGPSNEGYTLQISADGNDWSDLFSVGANTTRMVTGVASGSYYRMNGNNSEVTVNWRTQCNDGGSGGGSGAQGPQGPQGFQGPAGGGGDSAQTMTLINNAIANNNANLEDGDPIVGMAKQLYSPDGITSDGLFAYRTTAGDEDVSTGPAELRKVEGNATYPETQYSDDADLIRSGVAVEGFSADVAWGQTGGWENWVSTADSISKNVQKIKFSRTSNSGQIYVSVRYYNASTPIDYQVGLNYTTTGITVYDNKATAVTSTQLVFDGSGGNVQGVINYDGTDIIAEITGGSAVSKCLKSWDTNPGATGDQYIWDFLDIPNDIPIGSSEYTYDGSAWTPSLPQAITAMTLNGSTYVPESGDEITITRTVSKSGSTVYPAPETFVALGLNSFKKEGNEINFTPFEDFKIVVIDEGADYNLASDESYNVYAIKAVTGLSNGYVIYHKSGSSISWAGVGDEAESPDMIFSATVHTSTYDIVYPTAQFPYIVFSAKKDEENMICVHPRWSGYRDEEYEDYSESVIDLSALNEDCPLLSVGTTKNIWDLENQQLIVNIESMPYTAQAVEDLIDGGKVLGTDFDFDENYIYYVSDDPEVINIEFNNKYTANDFSVELFSDGNDIISMPVYAETYYMNNLVDKLRRMNGLVHLDNLDGTGNENTVYECDGLLWFWSDNGGTVAEWTDRMTDSNFGAYRGYGLIFSHIPNGQTLFEAKYIYDGDENYKSFKMSGSTLVMTNTGGTVLSACTVGETKDFRTRSNNSSSYLVKVKVEKHWIGFEIVGNHSLRNLWDGTVSGGHFGIVDHTNYPYMAISNDTGIARWNSKGQVIAKDTGYGTKNLYFNATGTSSNSRLTVLTNGTGNGPDHIFGPDNGGTAGQILTSNGNAAPVWSNWIKSVKITSDAYEALDPKDPNTLYLIVDE